MIQQMPKCCKQCYAFGFLITLNIMSKTKITKFENLCLKCNSGIIERIIKEKR
jgi:hypothetical protein